MKKYLLFVLVLAVSFLLFSCSEKGGTIEVTNSANGDPVTNHNFVIIVKGIDLLGALDELSDPKNAMLKGQTKTFNFDENGVYTVVALYPNPPTGFSQVVTLLAGNTVKVEIK